jgi:hypothetical protein
MDAALNEKASFKHCAHQHSAVSLAQEFGHKEGLVGLLVVRATARLVGANNSSRSVPRFRLASVRDPFWRKAAARPSPDGILERTAIFPIF